MRPGLQLRIAMEQTSVQQATYRYVEKVTNTAGLGDI